MILLGVILVVLSQPIAWIYGTRGFMDYAFTFGGCFLIGIGLALRQPRRRP